jgi:hypothetical protein
MFFNTRRMFLNNFQAMPPNAAPAQDRDGVGGAWTFAHFSAEALAGFSAVDRVVNFDIPDNAVLERLGGGAAGNAALTTTRCSQCRNPWQPLKTNAHARDVDPACVNDCVPFHGEHANDYVRQLLLFYVHGYGVRQGDYACARVLSFDVYENVYAFQTPYNMCLPSLCPMQLNTRLLAIPEIA